MSSESRNPYALATLTVTLVGLFLAYTELKEIARQIEQSQLHQRAQVLSNLHQRGFDSSVMTTAFYNLRQLGETNRLDTNMVKDVTILISFAEFVGQMEALGLIEKRDISEIFGYYFVSLYKNAAVQTLISDLRKTAENEGLPLGGVRFDKFIQLAKEFERNAEKHQKPTEP